MLSTARVLRVLGDQDCRGPVMWSDRYLDRGGGCTFESALDVEKVDGFCLICHCACNR